MKNIINISLRYLLSKKRHTIVTILLAAISAALITLILTMLSCAYLSAKNYEIETQGRYHFCIDGLTAEQAKVLSQNAIFSETEIARHKTFWSEDSLPYYNANEGKQLYLLYSGKENIYDSFTSYKPENTMLPDGYSSSLLNGRMPQNSSEVTLAYSTYSLLGKPELGSSVTFTVKQYELNDDADMNELNKLIGKFESSSISEFFHEIESQTFTYTVVGVQSNASILYPDENSMVAAAGGACELRGRFKKDIYDVNAEVDKALTSAGISSADARPIINQSLLNLEVIGVNAKANFSALFAFSYVFVLLILACARLLIDCAFEISSKEKTTHFGLLKSCGASNRQLRGILISESCFISVIAMPLGLLIGNLLALGLFGFIKDYLNTESIPELYAISCNMAFDISPILMAVTALTGAGWVFFSDYGSGVRMIKKMPVETMYPERSRKNALVKAHRSILKKIFGISGQLASINIRRNRKRYITTIISLSLSILLFIGFSFTVTTFEKLFKSLNNTYNSYDLEISRPADTDYHKLTNELNGTGYFTNVQAEVGTVLKSCDGENEITLVINAINKETYSHLTSSEKLPTYDELLQSDTLLFCTTTSDEQPNIYNLDKLKSLNYKMTLSAKRTEKESNENISIKICGHAESTYYSFYGQDNLWSLICTEEQYDNYFSKYKAFKNVPSHMNMNFADGKRTEALEYVNKLPGCTVYDYTAYEIAVRKTVKIAALAGCVVISLISFIAVINLINIIITGLLNRKREIGLLKAAGMADNQLIRTVFIESGLYSVISTLTASVIIFAVVAALNRQFAVNNIYSEFPFLLSYTPLFKYVAEAFAVTFALSLLTSVYAVREIKHTSIIETISCRE